MYPNENLPPTTKQAVVHSFELPKFHKWTSDDWLNMLIELHQLTSTKKEGK